MNYFLILGKFILFLTILELFIDVISAEEKNEPIKVNNESETGLKNKLWNFLYERSLQDTSLVKFLPPKVPKDFVCNEENKSEFFRSCFRTIRFLLKEQWKCHESQKKYNNPKLIPGMIKIGEDLKFSPPNSDIEKQETYENLKNFCIKSVNNYFEVKKNREDFINRCKALSVNPPNIKNIKRSSLPIDVRCRGENMLAKMEELDYKRKEANENEKEYLEKIIRGEIVPEEGRVPLQEVLKRFDYGKDHVEASQLVENPNFYKQWMNQDLEASEKLSALEKLKENPGFESLFGITKDQENIDYGDRDLYEKNESNKDSMPFKFQYSNYAIPGTNRRIKKKDSLEIPNDDNPEFKSMKTPPYYSGSHENIANSTEIKKVSISPEFDVPETKNSTNSKLKDNSQFQIDKKSPPPPPQIGRAHV